MEDLVESILDYVRADYTDYAIMINGEWGSGKTYFWNNKIRNKICEKCFTIMRTWCYNAKVSAFICVLFSGRIVRNRDRDVRPC